MKTKAGIGGTFNVLHKGHKTLFEKAFERADELIVGLVSDRMALDRKKIVRPYAERRRNLEKYLINFGKIYEIVMIEDIFGPAVSREDIRYLIVSERSQKNAKEINRGRKKRGLDPLEIEVVPTVMAEDFLPISSSRIIGNEIDIDGRLLIPLHVRVGSTNPVKVEAVRRVLRPLYGLLEVEAVKVDTGVPKEPRGDEVLKGAIGRAKAAIGDAHLGVGIEAGLFWSKPLKWYFDVQFCAIIDSTGRLTIGHGPGFWYPPKVIEEVEKGSSVDEAMFKLTGIEDIGHRMGSVGYLSKELINRTTLTEEAVIAAFIPRIMPELYSEIWRKL